MTNTLNDRYKRLDAYMRAMVYVAFGLSLVLALVSIFLSDHAATIFVGVAVGCGLAGVVWGLVYVVARVILRVERDRT